MTRVAVVGCGYWGLEHLRSYLLLDDVEIAVCDADRPRAEEAASRAGLDSFYTDYHEMLEQERPELVSVCTMPRGHLEITVAALEAGCNVLCEKPMAATIEEAKLMVEAAEGASGFLTIGYEMRYSARARAIKEFVDSGGLGHAVYARCWLFADFPWAYKKDMDLESLRSSVIAERRGGGTVSAGGIHAIDLALWMGDFSKVTTISAIGAQMFPRKRGASAPDPEVAEIYDVEDLATAFIRFDDGGWMVHEAAHGGIDRIDPENTRDTAGMGFVIVGENGTISFAPFQLLRNDENGAVVDETPPGTYDWGFISALTEEVAGVVDAVRKGEPPLVSPKEAMLAEQIKQAIYRSMEEQHEIPMGD